MEELWALPGGDACATNQVLYHLGERGIEWKLLPWMRRHRLPVMAYCPLGEGRLVDDPDLGAIAARLDATPAQVALAWLLGQGDAMAIPKASGLDHVRDNRAAAGIRLDTAAHAALEAAFPPPSGPTRLAIV